MPNHQDRAIIVTGAAGAIGFATAEILAAQGARLMLVDIAGDALEARGADLRATGATVETYHADCGKEEDVRGYVDATVAKFGRIDGFFNNAGVEGAVTPMPDYPVEEYDRILTVNLRGVFLGLKYVLQQMVAQGRARWSTPPRSAASAVSPAAGPTMPPSMALSASPAPPAATSVKLGIRVNCVEPGVIETPLLNEVHGPDVRRRSAKGPRQARLGLCHEPRRPSGRSGARSVVPAFRRGELRDRLGVARRRRRALHHQARMISEKPRNVPATAD
jgi:NAD(P)-dependent dehydrogenase (short-subunit alcohol dehydrogenase family)